MNEKERMLAGKLYKAQGDILKKEFLHAKNIVRAFNQTTELELEKRTQLLKKLFNKTGKNLYIEPPFRCDYGCNIKLGNNFYANYDCTIIDVNEVIIGDNVMFGPKVSIYTAEHPIDAGIRNRGLEYGKPVRIGNSVWIGGNTVINGGITIGDNSVIGSGSVVTKNIPANVVAVGNPCKVIRQIGEADKTYWEQQASLYKSEKTPT